MNQLNTQETTLYFQQGGSDKVYAAQIVPADEGYLVNFCYGKRGSALREGCKTPNPVTLEAAEKVFNKLINTKKSKGYTESTDGALSVVTTGEEKQASGIQCQLLNPIDEDEAIRLALDDNWVAQQKHDGERRLVSVVDNQALGVNRKSLFVALSKEIADGICVDTQMIIDGEDMGSHVSAFDLLELDGWDLRGMGFVQRYDLLIEAAKGHSSIKVSPLARTREEKLALLKLMEETNQEGTVFKLANAPYEVGRPNSGGSQLKFKLYATASVIVEKINDGKRSIAISGLDNESNRVALGNVTIPPNKSVPSVGKVVEIKYLYAFKLGSLYQPIYQYERTDIDPDECLLSQLKYKPDSVS